MPKYTTTQVVPADAPIVTAPGTVVLHTYDNGDLLVQVPVTAAEASRAKAEGAAGVLETRRARAATARATPQAETDTTHTQALRERDDRLDAGLDSVTGTQDLFAYVVLAGPPEGSVVAAIEACGVDLVSFEEPAMYLAKGSKAEFTAVRALPVVSDVVPQSSRLKPRAAVAEVGEDDVWVVVHTSAGDGVFAEVDALPGVELVSRPEDSTAQYRRVAATVTAAAVDLVLAVPGVAAVEHRAATRLEDEVADLIIAGSMDVRRRPVGNYLTWLADHGVSGAGVTIGIVDAGVDETHEAFRGRIVSKDGSTTDWHGTFVAGHAAGDYRTERDSNGFIYGVGMAPSAGLISQSNSASGADACRETVTTSANGVAGSVQNNSWGRGTRPSGMDYQSDEALYDGFVRNADGGGTPLTICFSAGNSGSDGLTRPKGAKNVIVTGNSESYRPEFASTNPEAAAEADNPDELYTGANASSHGNCLDGRVRPDVVAPGQWTSSANFDSHPGQAEFISEKLTWGGGTSGASPKTAGACALVSEWWCDNVSTTRPSPAMLRALLVNGATDIGFGGPVPNKHQGWGRLTLSTVLDDSVHTTYLDQTMQLVSNGERRQWNVRVSDPTKPVRVTLAWTDPPGAVGSGTSSQPAIVNRLALEVAANGSTYYGNDLANGWSRAGSPPPSLGTDNLQNVFLRSGVATESITVTVRAMQLAMNCLTNKPSDPRQDFALVIHNGFVDLGASPVDMTLLIDDHVAADPQPTHWAGGDDDGTLDGDGVWGDGSDRPTLRRGDRGQQVTDLQQMLTDTGYDTNGIDGAFGGGTFSAVVRFQRDHALTADGIVGQATWAALTSAANQATGSQNGPSGSNGSSNGDGSSGGDGSGSGTWSGSDGSGGSGGSDGWAGWDDPTPSGGGFDDTTGSATDGTGGDDGGGTVEVPDTSSRPVLRRGSSGGDVTDLQQWLTDLGYGTNGIDGSFGGGTQTAVIQFQRDQGLAADGVVGRGTWGALADAWAHRGGSETTRDPWATVAGGSTAEAHRTTSPPATSLASALAVATAALASSDTRVVTGGGDGASTSPTGAVVVDEATRATGSETTLVGAPGKLSLALRRLDDEWGDTSDRHVEGDTVRARSAIVVVGAGSTFTRDDVLAMRRLGRRGRLTIASADQQVLDWLAIRLRGGRGVQYRLLTTSSPADDLQTVVAESVGAQEIAVPARPAADGTTEALLTLTEHDREVRIVVSGAAPTARLQPPDGQAVKLTANSRQRGIHLRPSDNGWSLTLVATDQRPLAGHWTLTLAALDGHTPALRAYVTGRPPVRLVAGPPTSTAAPTGPATETRRRPTRTLTVHAAAGVLSAASIRSVTAGPHTELDRQTLMLSPVRSRLSSGDAGGEEMGRETATSAHLTTAVPAARRPGVVDVEVVATGVTPAGHRFRTITRHNVLAIPSRSELRYRRGRRADRWTLLRGTVAEVQYDGSGTVLAVRVTSADRSRVLRVDDPELRLVLRGVSFGDGELIFGVEGSRLQAIVHPLGHRP